MAGVVIAVVIKAAGLFEDTRQLFVARAYNRGGATVGFAAVFFAMRQSVRGKFISVNPRSSASCRKFAALQNHAGIAPDGGSP